MLLRKGQAISDDIIEKLKRHGIKDVNILEWNTKSLYQIRNIQKTQIIQNIHNRVIDLVSTRLEKRLNVCDTVIFEKASKMLKTIIFENKSEPWWVYINTLANYIGWLYTHSIDAALISMIIAVELGYQDEELFNIGLSAFLHDVGKLMIPKIILQKTDKLTETEQCIVRQHCDLGASSLQGYLPKTYIDVVMNHHERLDGSGYPKGLKENDISLNVRIVIVADVADSITSYCPYHQPRDMKFAMDKLKSEKTKYPQDLVLMLDRMLQV